MVRLSFVVMALVMVDFVFGNCQLSNSVKDQAVETRWQYCTTQGADSWTFTMAIGAISVPTFDSSAPFAGYASDKSFLIYDNTCKLRGVYSPSGNNCGIDYIIEENWLKYVLSVTSVNFDVGGGRFKFLYANGQYSIGENHCTCQDVASGLKGAQACKCAFPINGES
jgi:hypothetical protein